MANEKERIAAGFDYIFYGVVNPNGIVIGNDASGATAGSATGQGMTRLEGARTMPVGLPEDEVVTVTGDNEPKASFSFPSAELPSGVLELSTRNIAFEALVQGTLVQDIGDVAVGALGPSGNTKRDMALLLMRKAKSRKSGSKGALIWEIAFVPKCNIAPLYADLQERQFSPYRYGINMSKSDRALWGDSFTEAVNGYTELTIGTIDSDNPMQVHVFQGDNSRVAFTIGVAPKSNSKVYVYVNGVRQSPTVAGQLITFGSAPASGAYIHVLYEVDAGSL